MQAIMQPRLVKVQSTGAKAHIMQVKSLKAPAGEKTAGKGFLAVLLSALSAPGA